MRNTYPMLLLVAIGLGPQAATAAVIERAPIADAKLFYPYPLSTFPPATYSTTDAPPGRYAAQLQRGLCGGDAYGLATSTAATDGTGIHNECLNLETGALYAKASPTQPGSYDETLAAPVTSSTFFAYRARLGGMAKTLDLVNEKQAADYIRAVGKSVDALPIDAMLSFPGRGHSLGEAADVTIQYKISQDREVVLRFADKDATYVSKRQLLKASDSEATITYERPDYVDDINSTFVVLDLVPVGGDPDTAHLQRVRYESPSLRTQLLSFWTKDPTATLYAGADNPLVVAWSVTRPTLLMLRLFNSDDQIILEKTLKVDGNRDTSPDSKARGIVNLTLPANLPEGDHYTLEGRLLTEAGTWEAYNTKYAKVGLIQVRKLSE